MVEFYLQLKVNPLRFVKQDIFEKPRRKMYMTLSIEKSRVEGGFFRDYLNVNYGIT